MTPGAAYRAFWAGVGERFPDLGGAVSTDYYADNERRLFAEHLPPLRGAIIGRSQWSRARWSGRSSSWIAMSPGCAGTATFWRRWG